MRHFVAGGIIWKHRGGREISFCSLTKLHFQSSSGIDLNHLKVPLVCSKVLKGFIVLFSHQWL